MKRFAPILFLLLIFTLVPFTQAQGGTFGLSDGDFALFNAANAATTGISAGQFQFTLSFSTSGIPDTNVSLDLQGSGSFDTSGSTPALQLTLDGAMTAPEQTPLNLELRLIDDIVYVNAPDPVTGAQTWQGMRVEDLAAFSQSSFATGFEQGSGGMPFDEDMFAQFGSSLAALDASEFVTISRLNDEVVGGVNTTHFRTEFSLTDFVETDGFAAMLGAAAAAGGSGELSTSDLTMAAQMVGMMVSDSTISFDQFFGEDDELLRRAALNVDLSINGAMMGMTSPVNVAFNFAIDLSNHNQPQTIVAPEGVEIASLPDTTDIISTAPTVVVPTTEAPMALPTVASSSAQTIVANTPVEIQLTGSGPVDLVYMGSVNEVISVTARSLETGGAVDTTLEVLDANNTRLSYNDDHGTTRADLDSYDSYIRDLKLTSDGEVIIRVNSFSGVATGRVEVLVESSDVAAPPSTPVAQSGGSEVVNGNVPTGGTYDHTITAQQGEILTITVRSLDNSLDPKVALVDSSGSILIENDDHGTNDTSLDRYDSQIGGYTLPSSGTFTVQVSGFGGSGGAFELTIEREQGGVVATPRTVGTPGTIAEDVQTVQGSIRPNDTFTYHLEAQAGDVYTITVRAITNDFDPRVSVYDPAENFLITNDDHGSSARDLGVFDSRISNLILRESGRYTINVNGYQTSAGDFELIIERVDTGAPTGQGTDQVFTGEIRPNGTFTQTFEAQAGDYVTITVRALSTDFDPRVALVSPDDVIVADNDDVGTSDPNLGVFDSRIHNYRVTESGTYTVEVQGYQTSAGSFALTITTIR